MPLNETYTKTINLVICNPPRTLVGKVSDFIAPRDARINAVSLLHVKDVKKAIEKF